jgi:hypothetical protein
MKELLTIIPETFLKEIKENQEKIIDLLNSKENRKKGFVTEKEARLLFNRKSTWFWQMRKNGILPFSKIGKSIYYSTNDIDSLIENNKSK